MSCRYSGSGRLEAGVDPTLLSLSTNAARAALTSSPGLVGRAGVIAVGRLGNAFAERLELRRRLEGRCIAQHGVSSNASSTRGSNASSMRGSKSSSMRGSGAGSNDRRTLRPDGAARNLELGQLLGHLRRDRGCFGLRRAEFCGLAQEVGNRKHLVIGKMREGDDLLVLVVEFGNRRVGDRIGVGVGVGVGAGIRIGVGVFEPRRSIGGEMFGGHRHVGLCDRLGRVQRPVFVGLGAP